MNAHSIKRRILLGLGPVLVGLFVLCLLVQLFWLSPDQSPIMIWTIGGVSALLCLIAGGITYKGITSDLSSVTSSIQQVIEEKQVEFASADTTDTFAATMQQLADLYIKNTGLFKGIVLGLPMPFLLVDTKERALFTNQPTLDMLEIDGPVEHQLGRTLADIFYNDPSRETAVGKAMHKGQIFQNLEVTITGHKGGTRHVLANVYALRDASDTVIGGICLYLDMTDLKETEARLHEQHDLISQTTNKANGIADQLASASEEISTQVEQSSHSMDQSRELTANVAVSVDEMNATVLDVARNASNAAEVSDQAKQQAAQGASIVEDVINRISQVEAQANQLSQNMSALGDQANSIGSIMSVISDIADQTNLLALNAAIEAARAGDAGRGFAVVADEVRKLAEKTMDATRQVETNIQAIQASASANVTATQQTVTVVSETVETTRHAGEALSAIVELASQTSDNVQSIATAAEEQSATSEEIAKAVGNINNAANETSQAMHESAVAVTDLARLAGELHTVMDSMSR